MSGLTLAQYLQFANAQMAAEAFLVDGLGKLLSLDDQKPALVAGNRHTSRFSETQANTFLKNWTILSQQANTTTGFSGTLLKDNKTQNLVLALRSTEFIDDYARDNLATNDFEIKKTGWAWGQIADMEKWYAKLAGPGGDLEGKKFSVTGYSLGGHLATAFNLLHPGAAAEVLTFNGAGVGRIKGWTGQELGKGLANALERFNMLRGNRAAIAATFLDPNLGSLYQDVAAGLADGSMTLGEAREKLRVYTVPDAPNAERLFKDNARFFDALSQIEAIADDVARVDALRAGGDYGNFDAKPTLVKLGEIAAANFDYRMAVLLISQLSEAAPIVPNGMLQTIRGRENDDPILINQFDVMGDTQPSAISNSQWHHGLGVPVFIEDQPLYRGAVPIQAAWNSFVNDGIKLLGDHYAVKDFGDTHSLALIVDSLSTQETLLGLVQPDLKAGATADLQSVLRAASNLKRVDGAVIVGNDQGKSEGDVLEKIVNSLGYMLLGPASGNSLKGSPDGNTWARFTAEFPNNADGYTGRDSFFAKLDEIRKSPKYEALTDQTGAGFTCRPRYLFHGKDGLRRLPGAAGVESFRTKIAGERLVGKGRFGCSVAKRSRRQIARLDRRQERQAPRRHYEGLRFQRNVVFGPGDHALFRLGPKPSQCRRRRVDTTGDHRIL